MLEVRNLNKKVNGFSLRDINMTLPDGYICGLIGENGAGKSTLIKVLTGLYKSEQGEITVDGLSMAENEALVKNRIGVILDKCIFESYLTLEKVGRMYGSYYSGFDKRVYEEYLQKFKLSKKSKVKSLSTGMKIKAQLAFSLSYGAKLFIFDEPTAGLDKNFRDEFLNICMELIENGDKSVIISTHITSDLDRIADYIAYMQDGELLFCEEKDRLCDRFRIAKAENYKLKLLPKENVVYMEMGEFGGSAMVKSGTKRLEDGEYKIERLNIKEFMYYVVKGGRENAKKISELFL